MMCSKCLNHGVFLLGDLGSAERIKYNSPASSPSYPAEDGAASLPLL